MNFYNFEIGTPVEEIVCIMIKPYSYDVEIFPNLFSITFVDIKSYNETFADCVDSKGKPVALTEKLSVKEIKERLDKVKSYIFYISDTDDSQLLELVSFINNMQAYYETKTDDEGCVYQIPIRTDCFGYNNVGYDDYMIKAFLMQFNRFDETKYLIKYLYNLSKKIISLQSDKEAFYNDKEIELIKKYRLPYCSVDVQRIFALHASTVHIDKDTGERQKFGKSLKQTSINLKWHELLDFTLPPIDEEEQQLYWNKEDRYRGLPLNQLNVLITTDFDRYVLPKYVEPMLHYNKNDVFLVCEIARQKPDEIRLRYSIGSAFNLNILSDSRANIADKLIIDTYSKRSGLHKSRFENLRTERTILSFSKAIFPHIKFKTKQFQDLLNELKQVKVYHTNKDSFSRVIEFDGTTYTLAMGGIHTKDVPGIYKSNDKYTYVHFDFASYYPSIMVSYNIAPKHLNQPIFTGMVKDWRDWRVECKHTDDTIKQVIPNVPNKIGAEALKIVINAIFGKFGSDKFMLYDRMALVQTTLNGQLMTLTLIEELQLNGIHTVSANTDGIIIKIPNDRFDVFHKITDEWNRVNKMQADYEIYDTLVSRDVNNYMVVHKDGKEEFKGALNPKQYIRDLSKGYDMPVVAKAVYNYFIHNIPVMETLMKHNDILDFCKTQNVGKQFDVVYDKVENNKVVTVKSQRHVRFYVSTKGVIIQKQHKMTEARSKLASGLPVIILNSLDDKPIEERNINYKYYYEEAYKLINPIKLGISQALKPNATRKTVSGKVLLKKYAHDYLTLFDNDEE